VLEGFICIAFVAGCVLSLERAAATWYVSGEQSKEL